MKKKSLQPIVWIATTCVAFCVIYFVLEAALFAGFVDDTTEYREPLRGPHAPAR